MSLIKYYLDKKYVQIWYENGIILLVNHYWKGINHFKRYGFKSLYAQVTQEQLNCLLELENANEEEYEQLVSKVPARLYSNLIKYGFLISNCELPEVPLDYSVSGDNLPSYLRLQYGINQVSSPTKVQFLVTCRCFGNCDFCITNSSKMTDFYEMSDEQWVHLAKKFVNELNPCQIDIIGGEPLIRFEAVKGVCEVATHKNVMVRIITNGVILADEDKCHSLVTILSNHRHYIQLSVDGNEEIHNKIRKKVPYKKVLTAAKNLGESKINWGINLTVNKSNYELLEEVIEEFAQYNPIHFEIGPLQTSIKDPAMCSNLMLTEEMEIIVRNTIAKLQVLYPSIDIVYNRRTPVYKSNTTPKGAINTIQNSCSAFFKMMSILPDGRLVPCMRGCVHPEFFGENTLEEDSLLDLWRNSRLKDMFQNIPLVGKCAQCAYNSQCNQGCPLETYVLTGNLGGYNPECRL